MKQNVQNSIYLLFLNFLFWIGNYYPRHILESFSLETVSLIFMNLIFSIVYGYVLIISFSNINSFKEGIFSNPKTLCCKYTLKKLIAFVLLQSVVDIALFHIESFNSKWLYIVSTVMILLQWVISYILLAENRRNILKNRVLFCTGLFLILVLTIMSLFHDFACMTDFSIISSKYYSDASMFIAEKRIIDFMYQLKLLLFDSLLGIIFIIFHFLNNKNENKVNTEELVSYRFFKEFLRVNIVLGSFFIIFVIKTIIAPFGTISGYHSSNGFANSENHVDESYSFITVYKKDVNGDESIWFDKNEYCLHLDESSCLNLTLYGNYNYIIKDNHVVDNVYTEVQYTDDIINAYLYRSIAIVYKEYDSYNAVALDELKTYEYNDTVIEVCRKLISEGSIYTFEYVSDYLYKYDKDFILPYIERYRMGEFTSIEAEWMDLCRYKKEHIIDLAKRF